jgi:integral membrane protein
LIVHGWLYVVYLIADFRVWTLMRWPVTRFLFIALGGIVPFLSFYTHARILRETRKHISVDGQVDY